MNFSTHITRRLVVSLLMGAGLLTAGIAGVRVLTQRDSTSVVRGTVVAGKRDLTGMILDFSQSGQKPEERIRVTTTLGPGGAYEIHLPKPGTYRVAFRVTKTIPTRSVNAEVPAGQSEFNLTIPDTGLKLTVTGAPKDAAIQLEFEGPAGPGSSERAGVLVPANNGSITLVGLDPGIYRVSARTSSGLTTKVAAVVTVEESKTAQLVLPLSPGVVGRLKVSDSVSGKPIASASVTAGGTILAHIGSGEYPLEQLSAGRTVQISAGGYLPDCHVLREEDWPAKSIALLPVAAPSRIVLGNVDKPVGSVQMPGSACPVPLTALVSSTESRNGSLVVMVRLPKGEYTYFAPQIDAKPQTFSIMSGGSPATLDIPADCAVCGGAPIAATPKGK